MVGPETECLCGGGVDARRDHAPTEGRAKEPASNAGTCPTDQVLSKRPDRQLLRSPFQRIGATAILTQTETLEPLSLVVAEPLVGLPWS